MGTGAAVSDSRWLSTASCLITLVRVRRSQDELGLRVGPDIQTVFYRPFRLTGVVVVLRIDFWERE
ncbi:hypothetical protein CUMW_022720 [Citrus unshiu]|nr:hypothetical protein CUMW_022720 [Citrus unshiu]